AATGAGLDRSDAAVPAESGHPVSAHALIPVDPGEVGPPTFRDRGGPGHRRGELLLNPQRLAGGGGVRDDLRPLVGRVLGRPEATPKLVGGETAPGAADDPGGTAAAIVRDEIT